MVLTKLPKMTGIEERTYTSWRSAGKIHSRHTLHYAGLHIFLFLFIPKIAIWIAPSTNCSFTFVLRSLFWIPIDPFGFLCVFKFVEGVVQNLTFLALSFIGVATAKGIWMLMFPDRGIFICCVGKIVILIQGKIFWSLWQIFSWRISGLYCIWDWSLAGNGEVFLQKSDLY